MHGQSQSIMKESHWRVLSGHISLTWLYNPHASKAHFRRASNWLCDMYMELHSVLTGLPHTLSHSVPREVKWLTQDHTTTGGSPIRAQTFTGLAYHAVLLTKTMSLAFISAHRCLSLHSLWYIPFCFLLFWSKAMHQEGVSEFTKLSGRRWY